MSRHHLYTVRKRITEGFLAGMVVEETTDVEWTVGEVVEGGPYTGPGFEILSVEVAL